MEWLGDHLWAAWLLLAVALGVAEMVSLDLILLMMAVGALVAAVVAIAGAPIVLQVLLGGRRLGGHAAAGPPEPGRAPAPAGPTW